MINLRVAGASAVDVPINESRRRCTAADGGSDCRDGPTDCPRVAAVMRRSRWRGCAGVAAAGLALALTLAGLNPVAAQGWMPTRHVELVVPSAAGGNLDTFARPIERLWQQLKLVPTTSAVVNRGGGEHAVAYTAVRSRSGRIAFNHADITPIALLVGEPYVFIVRADSPIRTAADFVDAYRRDPAAVSLGIGNINNRIAAGLVLQAAGVDLKPAKIVSFTGTGGQATAVAGGHVDAAVTAPAQALPHLESGKVRAIAVTSSRRVPGSLAAVPTWEELGHKAGTYQTWRGVMAPKDITPAQLAYWESVFAKLMASSEFRAVAEQHNWLVDFHGAAETRRLLDDEYAKTKSAMTYLGLVR